MDDSRAAATAFLTSLLSKTLRITTSDTRLFVGEFKCTDADRNIILSRTYEYRLPPAAAPTPSVSGSDNHHRSTIPAPESESEAGAGAAAARQPPAAGEHELSSSPKVLLDLSSRYLGLVVVPGDFITKIEVEEFASQLKSAGGSTYAALARAGLGGGGGGRGGAGAAA